MLALVPLDNRPCTARFPHQIAAIGGDSLVSPPEAALGRFNVPGDPDSIARWLQRSHDVDALIVSVDMLAYGGLVASRRSLIDEKGALQRLQALREFRQSHPATPIYAFNVLMRLAVTLDGDAAIAHYYNVMRYARLADEAERFDSPYLRDELRKVTKEIPSAVLEEYQTVRARNHAVTRHMIDWLDEGIFDHLLVTQEDASEWGLHRREQDALLRHATQIGVMEKFSLHPGADEASLTLLARHWKTDVRLRVHWSNDADAQRIAPFEDRPYHQALQQHVAAMRGVIVEEIPAQIPAESLQSTAEVDFELFINAPVGGSQIEEEVADRDARAERLQPFADKIARVIGEGRTVALCDVGFPNGADNMLLGALEKRRVLGELAVFGAWNTAGNTTGTVLATCAALKRARDFGAIGSNGAAHFDDARGVNGAASLRRENVATATLEKAAGNLARQFLFERLVDDWFYQSRVRYRLDKAARERQVSPLRMTPAENEPIEAQARRELRGFAQLLAQRHFHAPLSSCEITLPWHRTFEVDVRAELG